MTQQLRSLRGIPDDAFCFRCQVEEEVTLHVLRECIHAKMIWMLIVPVLTWNSWPSLGLLDWLDTNLADNSSRYGFPFPWRIIFAATAWWIWKWRCLLLFDDDPCPPHAPLSRILVDVEDVCRCWFLDSTKVAPRATIQVAWHPPPVSWVKLNTDGAARGNPGLAGFGGLIRDDMGRWLIGFSGNLGIASNMLAELEAIRQGLQLLWDKGYRHVFIESDSTAVINCIKGRSTRDDLLGSLLVDIKELLARDWQWDMAHQYREGNRSADLLANMGLESSSPWQLYLDVPTGLAHQLEEDRSGVSYPRLVRA